MITSDEWDRFCDLVTILRELDAFEDRILLASIHGSNPHLRESGFYRVDIGDLELWIRERVEISARGVGIYRDVHRLENVLRKRGQLQ